MKIVELILDEDLELAGISAVSLVNQPAIDEQFVALKEMKMKFAQADKEKRILTGAALVPNRPIFRRKGEEEFYVFFSKATIEKAQELFFKKGNHLNATLEHEEKIDGVYVTESWIVTDKQNDKSNAYGLDVPEGTWMISMKIENDDIWNNYVKTEDPKVLGFSIEGYFSSRFDNIEKENVKNALENIEEEEAQDILDQIKNVFSKKYITLESYNDYPDSAVNNAKRAIELNLKNGNKCMTQTGKIRARQIAQKKKLSKQTLTRVKSYLARAEEYYDKSDMNACGTIAYLAWGGLSMKRYVESKLEQIKTSTSKTYVTKEKFFSEIVNDDYAIIDDRLAYSTKEKALEMANDLGVDGFHTHEMGGKVWYMPAEEHGNKKVDMRKCPPGFKKDYKKHKCVRIKSTYAEVGPRGGIRKSPKAPKSGTPNPNPKGKGTAKGDASTSRGAVVSKKDEATLKKKSDEFNERYKEKLGYGTSVGMLKSVFQRGLGAFNTSHSPRIKSPTAWAMARVNAFLYLVKNGRPQNPKYTGDFDLLPGKHPKKPK